jgi:hypothetical protein
MIDLHTLPKSKTTMLKPSAISSRSEFPQGNRYASECVQDTSYTYSLAVPFA